MPTNETHLQLPVLVVDMPTNETHLQLPVLVVDMTEVFYLTKLQKTFLRSIYKN